MSAQHVAMLKATCDPWEREWSLLHVTLHVHPSANTRARKHSNTMPQEDFVELHPLYRLPFQIYDGQGRRGGDVASSGPTR